MTMSKQEIRLAKIQKKVRPVTETNFTGRLYMLVWGRIKSGKTSFIATGPTPIIFLAEDGHMTVRNNPNVDVFPIDDDGKWLVPKWSDAWDFLYFLRYGDHDYKTVGMDSMSGLIDLAKRFILKDEEARDEEREPGTPDKRTWGRLATTMVEYIEELEAVCAARDMHLILTAHERSIGENDDEELEGAIVPDMTPAMRKAIVKRPAILARTFIEQDEEEIEEVNLKYGMIFRDAELMVGERLTPPEAEKPWLPAHGYNVTIPKLVRVIKKRSTSDGKTKPKKRASKARRS